MQVVSAGVHDNFPNIEWAQ